MEGKSCCFSGHRKLPSEPEVMELRRRMRRAMWLCAKQGVINFLTGGALGFDTIAALEVLRMREEYPDIRLVLVLPCEDQTKGWRIPNVDLYRFIKREADEVICLYQQYVRGCMQQRNRYLAEHSQWCICYLNRGNGGTKYTVDLCRKNGVEVINLADEASLI